MGTYRASTALPYPHRQRASQGLRAELRHRVPVNDVPDWETLTVTGPVEDPDARGVVWFRYEAEVHTRETPAG